MVFLFYLHLNSCEEQTFWDNEYDIKVKSESYRKNIVIDKIDLVDIDVIVVGLNAESTVFQI